MRPVANTSSGNSRWVDYDTHELLNMISELEDERRWARLREGIWIAILVHLFLLSAVTWIPKYLLKVPTVVDPFEAIKQRKDLTYLDLPPDALEKIRPKAQQKPLSKPPSIDKKTLEDMQKSAPAPPPPAETKAPEPAPAQQPPPPAQTQPQLESPKPPAVPARPNFAMGSQNPADQLQEAMKNAARSHGQGDAGALGPNVMPQHPGAGTGGVQVLSDTQGVDFSSWLQRWHYETERTWDPLIPDEVNPPIYKSGMVAVQFRVLPNGQDPRWEYALGWAIGRCRARSCCMGRADGFELSAVAKRLSRAISRVARLLHVQHASPVIGEAYLSLGES